MNHIIPKPYRIKENPGFKTFNDNSNFLIDESFLSLSSLISSVFSVNPQRIFSHPIDGMLYEFFIIKDENMEKEEYSMEVNEDSVTIYASQYAGAFYAIQTLIQLIQEDDKSHLSKIPACTVWDKPRFRYRGLHLDVARHFFRKEEVIRLIELMSFYKLNVLHLHLTDDQGWRIEINSYPNLTRIGSQRVASQVGAWGNPKFEKVPHYGYYTKNDIREIVAYAEMNNIMVIPEIDMPAHSGAAIASYNFLSCSGRPVGVPTWFCDAGAKECGQENWNHPLCLGKKSTYDFIYCVLSEVCELFPAPYFHIGCDEAPTEDWLNCPHCLKDKDISPKEFQAQFINHIREFLVSKGKRAIVWNDGIDAAITSPEIICQYWTQKRDPNVINHIKNGGEVIISKHDNLYFDSCYSMMPLEYTLHTYPTFLMIPKQYEENILGMEGTVWTEWISKKDKLDFQIFPRMLALSEACWRERGEIEMQEFLSRWQEHKKILDCINVNYAEDEISMPKGRSRTNSIANTWQQSDSDCEYKSNMGYKKRTSKQ